MSLDTSPPAEAPDQSESAPDQSLLERLEDLETRAADAAALDEIANRLDRIETRLARPNARIEVREDRQALEAKAFDNYLRRGLDGMPDLERKVLQVDLGGSPNVGGGYLAPEDFQRELLRNLVELSPFRQVARVTQASSTPVLFPKRVTALNAAWVAETSTQAISEPAYQQLSIPILECRVTAEVTNALLEDAAFDLGAELARDLAESFAKLEGAAFVSGNGTTQPQGFLSSADFTSINAGASTFTADNIIDLYHAIPSAYSSRGTWLMRRETMGAVRKLKTTGTGVYLWTESLQPGNPPSLLGRPVTEMPDMTLGGSPSEPVVAFGDWNAGYRILERTGLTILRDPYTRAMQSTVQFHARRRVGGWLVLGEAVKGLRT